MTATAGKKLLVRSSTTGLAGSWAIVAEMNDATCSISGNNEDITVFGNDFIRRLQTLKDGSFSVSGFYDPTDADGQMRVLNALLDDTRIFMQFVNNNADLTVGFQQEVKVSSFEVSGAVDGVQELSMEFEGHDTLTTTLT